MKVQQKKSTVSVRQDEQRTEGPCGVCAHARTEGLGSRGTLTGSVSTMRSWIHKNTKLLWL